MVLDENSENLTPITPAASETEITPLGKTKTMGANIVGLCAVSGIFDYEKPSYFNFINYYMRLAYYIPTFDTFFPEEKYANTIEKCQKKLNISVRVRFLFFIKFPP